MIPNATVSLNAVCTQPDVGSLPLAGFSTPDKWNHLPREGCVLDFLPAGVFQGLRPLESLRVSTNSPVPPRLEQDSLFHVPLLTNLDLSSFSARSFPTRELCSLPSPTSLNVSNNEIGPIHDLGLSISAGSDCLCRLSTLDLARCNQQALHGGG